MPLPPARRSMVTRAGAGQSPHLDHKEGPDFRPLLSHDPNVVEPRLRFMWEVSGRALWWTVHHIGVPDIDLAWRGSRE